MSEVETWETCIKCGKQFDVEQTECPTNNICQDCWNELKSTPEKVKGETVVISDMDEINEYELMLIRMQIIKVDGVNDDEYSAWKSILDKVRKYNEEHQ